MERLLAVDTLDDLPAEYEGSPVARLLAAHNLAAALEPSGGPELLVATCMDHRVSLRMPPDFAYVLRTGGADLGGRDFEVSFAAGVGGVGAVAVVGHSDCGMAGVTGRRAAFVEGLSDRAGRDAGEAAAEFDACAPRREIGDPISFTLEQTGRLRRQYPGILVAPLHYRVEDRRLYLVGE